MAETKHTPTPYALEDEPRSEGDDFVIVVDGAPIAAVLGTDNFPCASDAIERHEAEIGATARFIVTACNSHDDLVAAWDRFLAAQDARDALGMELAIGDARAALTKARGGT